MERGEHSGRQDDSLRRGPVNIFALVPSRWGQRFAARDALSAAESRFAMSRAIPRMFPAFAERPLYKNPLIRRGRAVIRPCRLIVIRAPTFTIEALMTNLTIAACAGTMALACAVIQPAKAADMPQYPQYGGPPPVEQEPYVYQQQRPYYQPAPPPVVYQEYAPPEVVPVPGPYYYGPPRRVYVAPGYGYGYRGYGYGYRGYGYGYRPYVAGGYGYHRPYRHW